MYKIQANQSGTRSIEVSDQHLETIDKYQLLRNLVDSNGITLPDVVYIYLSYTAEQRHAWSYDKDKPLFNGAIRGGMVGTDFGDESQPFFKNGIPMSNRQEIDIDSNTRSINLEVIRMVAKVQLSITNTSSHPITIRKVVLSDQTPNSMENLMLFPAADEVDNQGVAHVGKPNLCTQQKQVVTYEGLNNGEGYTVSAHGGKQYIRFYVNESEATDENKYFVLQLHTDDGNGGELTRRYAMLNWRQMCRNDFRMIPIQLDDYAIG